MRFNFEVCPLVISISLLETSKVFDKSLTSSAFAAPSTGGDSIFTFNAPPNSPTISLFDERGTTLTLKIIAPSFSVKFITSN